MAYKDALFQLGMDLTRSSTAQKEDHGETARVAHSEPESGRHPVDDNNLIERDGVRTAGHQLIVDLFGASKLDDLRHIEQTLKRCVEVAGATLLHVHLQRSTQSGGVSGVAMLSGSHIAIHTWPGQGYATLDVFMSGDSKASQCVAVLLEAFSADKVVVKTSRRGDDVEPTLPTLPSLPAIAAEQQQIVRSQRARTRVRKAA